MANNGFSVVKGMWSAILRQESSGPVEDCLVRSQPQRKNEAETRHAAIRSDRLEICIAMEEYIAPGFSACQ